MPHWIDTPAALDAHLQRRPTRIGLDTEFVRERTFWPQLALVQIALDDEVLLVDPLAPGMTDALRPWTIDFHVAQNDGTVHGTGSHDKTGRHCPADDPNGKLDILECSGYWLKDAPQRGIQHICWDGCMFPNAVMEAQQTWNDILGAMVRVRDAHGWRE